MGDSETLSEIMLKVGETSRAKGWWDPPNTFGEQLLLAISEITEAYEEIRDGRCVEEIYYSDDGKPEGVPVEIGDAIIRLLDVCDGLRIPIVEAIKVKMAYNNTRPFRHGGKLK